MNTLIHLCRKDFSFARPALWGAWAVFLVAALMPRFITGALVEAAAPILGLLQVAQYFQIFSATLKILRADTYSGGHAFIGTRPVTKSTLWLSKILGISVFVLFPWWITTCVGVLASGIRLSPSDWILLVAEKTLFAGSIASIALVVGTHARHFVRTLLLTIALGAAMLYLAVFVFNRPGVLNFTMDAGHLKVAKWLVLQGMVTVSGLWLSRHWIVKRNPVTSFIRAVACVACIGLCSAFWSLNFVEPLAAAGTDAKPEISWTTAPQIASSTRNGEAYSSVQRGANFLRVPETWSALPAGVRSEARFADGGVIASMTSNSPTYGNFTQSLLPSLGIRDGVDSTIPIDPQSFTWFDCTDRLLRGKNGQSFSLSGEAMVELFEPIVLAELPARSGESAVSGRSRYRIERVAAATDASVTVEISATGAAIHSRGGGNLPDSVEILLVNARGGQHTRIGHMSGSSSAAFGWFYRRNQIPIEGSGAGEQIDAREFLKGARLYLIGRRYHGTVRVPFQMPEIRLESHR